VLGEPPLAVRVVLGQVDEVEQHDAPRQGEGRLDRVGQPLPRAGLHGEPVDHHLDGVLFLLPELGGRFPDEVGQWVDDAVDANPRVALGLQFTEQVDVLTLAAAHHRREHHEPGALVHRQHPVDYLLRALLRDPLPAHRAVRLPHPGEQQSQIVVDLGDRADGRPWVAGGGLLVDRDRGTESLDEVHVRLVHLPQELAGVRRQRLDVAPLPLSEDGVEREAGLSRPGQAGEHDHGVAGQVEAHVAQIVLARTADDQSVRHCPPNSRMKTRVCPLSRGPITPCRRAPVAPRPTEKRESAGGNSSRGV
jgi:hypothetical protein